MLVEVMVRLRHHRGSTGLDPVIHAFVCAARSRVILHLHALQRGRSRDFFATPGAVMLIP